LLIALLTTRSAFAVDIAIGDPPGNMYDLGGYDLQMYCTGKGSPTVIIDTGLGSSSMEWLDIQHTIGKNTRICSYDRAGYGWSDGGPGPRDVELLANELHQLLAEAEIDPPYLMVGHSFGGYVVQYFTETHPDAVAGMVLIESSHPEQATRLKALLDSKDNNDESRPRNESINHVMLSQSRGNPMGTPAQIGEFLNSRRKALYSQMDELKHFAESGQQVAAKRPLPEMPLIVISRGQPVWTSAEGGKAAEVEWQQLQKELSALTRQSERRIAQHSGHNVHQDQPDMVIEAINDVLAATSNNDVSTAGITR